MIAEIGLKRESGAAPVPAQDFAPSKVNAWPISSVAKLGKLQQVVVRQGDRAE